MFDYRDIRPYMQPGDLIAFGGKGMFSNIIKSVLRAPVSHVAGVHKRISMNGGDSIIEVVESTSLYGNLGVQTNRLSTHVNNYTGELWWIPLDDEHRAKMNHSRYFDFVEKTLGKPYDFLQAIGSAIDWIDKLGLENDEDYTKFFCSEWWAGAHKWDGVIPDYINPSEATPLDVCQWKLYGDCYQFSGSEEKTIPGFNSKRL